MDLLNRMDAGYFTELRQVNELNAARFEARMDQRFAEMETKFERRFAEMDTKFETRFAEMDAKFERRFAEQDVKWERRFAELAALMHRDHLTQMRWLVFLWLISLSGALIQVIRTP